MYSGTGPTIFIILATTGCAWALGSNGGCTMCSYISESMLKPISSETMVNIFQNLLEKYEIEKPTALKLFTSGSFLNPKEFPEDARDEILKIICDNKNITEFIVESRPEYVTSEVLDSVCSKIPDKLFEISMGLETSNDYIRNYKINKGFTCKDFEKAVNNIIKFKKKYNIKSKAYILIKPILTTEKEAMDDAINTARYCEDKGVDRISFCPSTVHKGTLMSELWYKKSYYPPRIWSVVEVLNEVRTTVNIPSVVDTSGFGTRRGPYNCKKCNIKLKKLIMKSNLKQDTIHNFDCDCKTEWLAETVYGDMCQSPSRLQYKLY